MDSTVKIELEINLASIKETIEQAKDLNDSDELFNKLVEVYRAKKQLLDAVDEIYEIESEVKTLIKNKATALYGDGWTAIKGNNYKIIQMNTGSVYAMTSEVQLPPEFVKVEQSLNTKKVDDYIKQTGKLPEGVEYNPNRGKSVRVTVNANGEAEL